MQPLAAAVVALIGLITIFSAVWAWQLKTKNAGMIDPVWAYSLGLVAVLYAVLGNGDAVTRALTALGGLVWGVRLGTHLWKRNYGGAEDARYRRFRETWGNRAAGKVFWLFQSQVVVSMLLSIAFMVPSYRSSPPAIGWILLAIALWIVSVAGESIADRQLKRFAQETAEVIRRVGTRAGVADHTHVPAETMVDRIAAQPMNQFVVFDQALRIETAHVDQRIALERREGA